MKIRSSPPLARRWREVVGHAPQGWIHSAIANPWKTPQGSVCRELAASRDFGRGVSFHDFDEIGWEQWPKIDLMEAESWGAEERSEQWLHMAQFAPGKMGDLTRTQWTDRQGDRRFLGEVASGIVERHKAACRRLKSQNDVDQKRIMLDFKCMKMNKNV